MAESKDLSLKLKVEELPILKLFLGIITAIAGLYLFGLVWGVLGQFSDILLLLFLAWLLSFILGPLVNRLGGLGAPRVIAAGIIYLLVTGVAVLLGLIFIPLLAKQTSSFLSALSLSDITSPILRGQLQPIFSSFQAFSAETLASTIALAASVFNFLFGAFLVLIFSFFFVIDGERFWRIFLSHVPGSWHDEILFTRDAVSISFSGFLLTQVLLGVLMGAVTLVVLLAFGVQYSILAATFAGLLMIVPVLGPLLSIIPPILITQVTHSSSTLAIAIILFALASIVVNIIGPLLFKRSIGLHPLVVLVSFLVGFKLAGVWGALFAVPVAGIILIVGSQLLRHWFGPGGSVPEPDWPLG